MGCRQGAPQQTWTSLSRREFLRRAGGAMAVLTGLAPALALVGCGGPPAAAPVQPVPIYSGDTCARCGMLISDLREAAEILGRRRQVWKFDDLGEMFAFHREHHLAPGDAKAMFVHDYRTRAWLLADKATYVVSRQLHTPMDFDVAAFADPAAARAFAADRQGTMHPFAELLDSPPYPPGGGVPTR